MKLIISDILCEFLDNCGEDIIITNNGNVHNCIGCFGCWIKTPGQCLIRDGYETMGKNLSLCSELILISECVYGSTSPFVKNILDRSISYIHPNFCIRNGEMHHKRRYDNVVNISAYFYGENITEQEKETSRKLIKANAVNFDGNVGKIAFFNSIEELRGIKI